MPLMPRWCCARTPRPRDLGRSAYRLRGSDWFSGVAWMATIAAVPSLNASHPKRRERGYADPRDIAQVAGGAHGNRLGMSCHGGIDASMCTPYDRKFFKCQALLPVAREQAMAAHCKGFLLQR